MALVSINSGCYQRHIKSSSYRRTDSTRGNVSHCTLTHSVTTLVLSPSHYKPVPVLVLPGIIGMTPFSTFHQPCSNASGNTPFMLLTTFKEAKVKQRIYSCQIVLLNLQSYTFPAAFCLCDLKRKHTHTVTFMLSRWPASNTAALSSAAPSVWRHRQ